MSVVTWCMGIAVMLCALYIMANGLGLVDSLDFGAGAYYYADIPEFEKKLNWDTYAAKLPGWVYYLLFFARGAVVWFIWKWVEKKK
jgi:hypothetical protein